MEEYPMNKKGQEIMQRWQASVITSLDEAYKQPSINKRAAWKYCQELCEKLGGEDLKIIGYNSMAFTVAFKSKTHLYYFTKDYHRSYYLGEDFGKTNKEE